MPIDSRHPDYLANVKKWNDIRDNLGGEYMVKSKTTTHLPMPNPNDQSADNQARYKAYLQRASYFAATRETQRNLVGRAFAMPPIFTGPEEMEPLINNIDGSGVTAEQQAKCTLNHVTAYSRAGVWTDYPETEGETTKADEEAGFVSAKIICYDPFDIINWDTITIGAKTMLSLVVIEEDYITDDDGYEKEYAKQWRELALIDGVYTVRLWREDAGENGTNTKGVYQEFIPTDSTGSPFNEIPFVFVGAEANEHNVEYPQLLDIANLNLSHYRLSADEAQALHILQPTPWLAGLNQTWVDTNYPGGTVRMGSSATILLPEGGSAGLLEPKEVTALGKAMAEKEEQMQKLGAKLVQDNSTPKTATEKSIEEASRTSVLAANCNNVSAAYSRALDFAAKFSGMENEGPDYPDGATFNINTDFAVVGMTPEEQAAITNSYNAGMIDYDEARLKLKEAGIAFKDNEEVMEFHEAKQEKEFASAQATFAAANTDD